MGRERGYPLGARGSLRDADYEDGSVPLQLPLSGQTKGHPCLDRNTLPIVHWPALQWPLLPT